MMQFKVMGMGCLMALVVCMPVFGASLEEIGQAMEAAWAKHETMQADLGIKADFPMGAQTVAVTGTGDIAYKKSGETEKYKQSIAIALPEPVKMEMRFATVFDGEKLHVLTDMMGMRQVKTEEPTMENGALHPGGKSLIDALEEEMKVKVLPEEEIDGKKAYVLEATPKEKNEQMGKMVLYIEQEQGMLKKIDITDPKGADLVEVLVSNVRFDEELEDSLFTPPSK